MPLTAHAHHLAGALDDAQDAYRVWSDSLDPDQWPVDLALAATLERTARHIDDALRATTPIRAYALLEAASEGCTTCAAELARTTAIGPQAAPGRTAALRQALWALFLRVDLARRVQAASLRHVASRRTRRARAWRLNP